MPEKHADPNTLPLANIIRAPHQLSVTGLKIHSFRILNCQNIKTIT